MSIDEEITSLRKLIKYHQDNYYNGKPEISDAEYDALFDRLCELAGDEDSDTNGESSVGIDSSSDYEKVKHIMPMGSQRKASIPEKFWDFISGEPDSEYIVEYKMDGCSLELQYNNGKFFKGITRGNGVIGDDITKNVLKMKGVVKEIPNSNFTGSIRGEVVLDHYTFGKKYFDKANCRNAANGLMKRKDGIGCEDLTIVTYDVFETIHSGNIKTELSKLEFLEKSGFNVVPYRLFGLNGVPREYVFNEITDMRDKLNLSRKENYDFDVDGLVIKHLDCLKYEEDAKNPKPKHQIAYKFSLEEAETTLIDVEWSVSGAKRTPVAICNPVELCGTKVSRALLCNVSLIKRMGLKIGSKVIMVKRGEIIPKIESVIYTPDTAKDVYVPEKCEFCGGNLELSPNETFLQCSNPKCPEAGRYRISYWVGVLGIKELGMITIKKLQDLGVKLNTISDLYRLTIGDMVSKGFSEAIGNKIISEIERTKKTTLSKFIAGFSMDGVGETTIESVLNKTGISTWEEYRKLTVQDLQNIQGIGEITAHLIIDSLTNNLSEMDDVYKFMKFETFEAESSSLAGMSFCITGNTVICKSKDELKHIIRNAGGVVTDSVTKSTTHLICNDLNSGSGKLVKAQKLGIKILSEEEVLNMID